MNEAMPSGQENSAENINLKIDEIEQVLEGGEDISEESVRKTLDMILEVCDSVGGIAEEQEKEKAKSRIDKLLGMQAYRFKMLAYDRIDHEQ